MSETPKKKTKSDKLYSDSPSIKHDKSTGEASIKRPSEADAVDMGIDGNPLPTDNAEGMPVDVVKQRITEMHERHATELKDMHKRHQKDLEVTIGGPSDSTETKE